MILAALLVLGALVSVGVYMILRALEGIERHASHLHREQRRLLMAFKDEVLAKIAEQTTRLASIDTALEALVAEGTISQADKDAIMGAFGTTDEQLARAEAALAANVPPPAEQP